MCSSAVATWGSTADEHAAGYPCDGLIDGPHQVMFRAVDVAPPAGVVFRWLCQLRVAPYRAERALRVGTPGSYFLPET